MDNSQFGFKELYSVLLKTTYPLEIKGRKFEVGETVAAFDRISIANFEEVKNYITANGGFENRARVNWETTKEIQLIFSQGVFSKTQFALMNGLRLFDIQKESLCIPKYEEKESDENGVVVFSMPPAPNTRIFIYDKSTGDKIISYEKVDDTHYNIGKAYCGVILDYAYAYDSDAILARVGQPTFDGYLYLIGKTRFKDDESGATKTGIITIPRLKLMSDLSIRLGKNAAPVVGTLRAKALPVGSRANTMVMDLTYLNDDIDSDI